MCGKNIDHHLACTAFYQETGVYRREERCIQTAYHLMQENKATISINRAPVLTLWTAVVAERFGYTWDEGLSLGRAIAGTYAQAEDYKRNRVRYPAGLNEATAYIPDDIEIGEDCWIRIINKPVFITRTECGIRALVKNHPIEPGVVAVYLAQKFMEHFQATREAMTMLAESYTLEELIRSAYGLYRLFRPGSEWGNPGVFRLERIYSLIRNDRDT